MACPELGAGSQWPGLTEAVGTNPRLPLPQETDKVRVQSKGKALGVLKQKLLKCFCKMF